MRNQDSPDNIELVHSISKISNNIRKFIILNNTFKIGFYFIIVSFALILFSKTSGFNIWPGTYWIVSLPLFGLLIGFITGLFNKLSHSQTALIIDEKLNTNYYIPTSLETVSKKA